jgi:hypothetical protein
MENFEKASRLKLRFETNKGQVSTEELFDLSLQSLDTVAKMVNNQLRNEGEESFLPSTSSKAATHNTLRLDILKHVIEVKVREQEARKTRADNAATLARLKELALNKSDEQLAAQSLEEINKRISELEALV